LRKRAAEADARLKRLYDAIENGVADLADPLLKDRIAQLKATRDQVRADAERAEGALDRLGPAITPRALTTFARTARRRMRTESGGYRRDPLPALAHRVEVDSNEACRKACCYAPPLQARKRRVLACPVLHRSGAPGMIRTSDPKFVICRLVPGHSRRRTMLHADPNIVRRCWQDGMPGIPSRKQLAPFVRSRRAKADKSAKRWRNRRR
jgi:hypothetical protein